jgi:glycosyltransferase involved in cell wall biosynthesis
LALCVPAFNAARFLPRLLDSAAAQTIPFDEILVYDDCSTDDTAAVAVQCGARVIKGHRNVGCSAGKNALLRACSSDWIHFHDADDELLPNFTTAAAGWTALPNAPDVVLFNYEYRDNDTNELITRSTFDDAKLQSDPLRYAILTQINPFCGVYRREALEAVGGYDLDPEILFNEDVAFHCKLAAAGLTFRADEQICLINYRVNGSMSAANRVKCLRAHYHVMRKMAASVGARYGEDIASRLWVAATGLASVLEWDAADKALATAWQLFPRVPRGQGRRFSQLCRIVGPSVAFRIREHIIRFSKPHLR